MQPPADPTPAFDSEVVQWLEEAIQALPGTLTPQTQLEGFEGWDSMGMVLFMGLVHERSGHELSVYEVRACQTPAALAALVRRRSEITRAG